MYMDLTSCIIAVLTGLATAIPLIVKLIEYVKKSIQEKNWNKLMELVLEWMAEAEKKFEDGATRKEWVISMAMASARSINYEVDVDALSEMIDMLCAMSKVVNVQAEEAVPAE